MVEYGNDLGAKCFAGFLAGYRAIPGIELGETQSFPSPTFAISSSKRTLAAPPPMNDEVNDIYAQPNKDVNVNENDEPPIACSPFRKRSPQGRISAGTCDDAIDHLLPLLFARYSRMRLHAGDEKLHALSFRADVHWRTRKSRLSHQAQKLLFGTKYERPIECIAE
jgi:hypothetical protein